MKKFLLCILMICLMTGCIKKNDNSELLEKYTFVRDENILDFYDMEYKIVNITTKNSDNLLKDKYISFESIYSDYILVSSNAYGENNENSINIYESNNKPSMMIWSSKKLYSYGGVELDYEDFKEKHDISLEEVFERNNINDQVDLIYNIVMYSKKEVTANSTENEIIDNYVFEVLRPLMIPYSNENEYNEFIFFTGDIYGFATINDRRIFVEIKNGVDSYKIILEVEGYERITEEQIINMVSTIKLN